MLFLKYTVSIFTTIEFLRIFQKILWMDSVIDRQTIYGHEKTIMDVNLAIYRCQHSTLLFETFSKHLKIKTKSSSTSKEFKENLNFTKNWAQQKSLSENGQQRRLTLLLGKLECTRPLLYCDTGNGSRCFAPCGWRDVSQSHPQRNSLDASTGL